VLGFLFNWGYTEVVLILKNRPDWQAGRLNGVGGGIEKETDGWDAANAMRREFREETGLDIEQSRWRHICTLGCQNFDAWIVFVYGSVLETSRPLSDVIMQTTDEPPVVVPVADIPRLHTIPNLRWLVPMASNSLQGLDRADYFKVEEIHK
jgi:8-oxo-dGTP diphosphatase